MSGYAEFWAAQLRLVLLCLLAELPEYRANSRVLTAGAASYGLSATGDQVRVQLAWLAEQGLVTTDELRPDLIIATATERGLDVAAGRAKVPGVDRPSPKA